MRESQGTEPKLNLHMTAATLPESSSSSSSSSQKIEPKEYSALEKEFREEYIDKKRSYPKLYQEKLLARAQEVKEAQVAFEVKDPSAIDPAIRIQREQLIQARELIYKATLLSKLRKQNYVPKFINLPYIEHTMASLEKYVNKVLAITDIGVNFMQELISDISLFPSIFSNRNKYFRMKYPTRDSLVSRIRTFCKFKPMYAGKLRFVSPVRQKSLTTIFANNLTTHQSGVINTRAEPAVTSFSIQPNTPINGNAHAPAHVTASQLLPPYSNFPIASVGDEGNNPFYNTDLLVMRQLQGNNTSSSSSYNPNSGAANNDLLLTNYLFYRREYKKFLRQGAANIATVSGQPLENQSNPYNGNSFDSNNRYSVSSSTNQHISDSTFRPDYHTGHNPLSSPPLNFFLEATSTPFRITGLDRF